VALVLLDPVEVEVPAAVPVPAAPSDAASPNSTKSTVAPLALMPMKLPTRGGVVPESPLPLVLVLWALVVGALNVPVQPCAAMVLL
jgi:hypothetical protein